MLNKRTHTHTHTLAPKQQAPLRLFTSNVRGIVKHWDVIKQINFDKYDILLFCEIWQIKNFENLIIEDFKIATVYQRENCRGGGVIIFIRSSIKYESVEAIVQDGIIESAAIKIKNTIIMILYRPPEWKQTTVSRPINRLDRNKTW